MMETQRFGQLVAISTLILFLAPMTNVQGRDGLAREKGAVYLEDISNRPYRLKIKQSVPIYTDLRAQRAIGQSVPGATAELVAVHEKALRVRTRAAHGDVVGWMTMSAIEVTDPKFFEKIKRVAARQAQVQQLIDKKEVALGMTPAEVKASLGKPDRENTSLNRRGMQGSFDYITYDRVPRYTWTRDYWGRPVKKVIYVKVETGRLTVSFENGLVTQVDTTRERSDFESGHIVVPPLEVF